MTEDDIAKEARIEARAFALFKTASEKNMFVTGDGRVGEEEAAQLLCLKAATLAGWRSKARGPTFNRRGGNGHRVTYWIRDLAAWIQSGDI